MVCAYSPSLDERDTSVVTDNVGAGRQAIEQVISCGRKGIADISGDFSYVAAQDRALGRTLAVADHGLPLVRDDYSMGRGPKRGAAALFVTCSLPRPSMPPIRPADILGISMRLRNHAHTRGPLDSPSLHPGL